MGFVCFFVGEKAAFLDKILINQSNQIKSLSFASYRTKKNLSHFSHVKSHIHTFVHSYTQIIYCDISRHTHISPRDQKSKITKRISKTSPLPQRMVHNNFTIYNIFIVKMFQNDNYRLVKKLKV